MDLASIVKNPVFVFVTGAVGGLCGALLKARADVYTSEAKRRQDMVTHFIQQIEVLAPSYYLMSNHAYLLSSALNYYLQIKQELQMTLQDQGDYGKKYLDENAADTAKEALFEAGKLYRVMTDRFWNKGGDYLVPDLWANEALAGLHGQIMSVLRFDSNILLKYIDSDIQRHEFLDKLKLAEEGGWGFEDLREQYVRYTDWVLKQDKEVKCLAANAQAYSELFSLELKRLYKDVWGKTADKAVQAREVIGPSTTPATGTKKFRLALERLYRRVWGPTADDPATALSAGTRKLIQSAAGQNDRLKKRQADAQSLDADAAMSDAFLSVGWSYYSAGQFDRAIEEYTKAKDINPGSAVVHNNLGNAYTSSKDYKNAAEAYTKASELDDTNPIFPHNHGRMLSRSGRDKEAAGLLDQAIEYQAATVLLDKAIKLGSTPDRANDRGQAQRYNDLGWAFSDLKRYDDAIESFGEAIVRLPLEPILYDNLARAYEAKCVGPPKNQADLEALDAAAGAYSMAASLSSGYEVERYQRNAAAVYRKAKQWKAAASMYQQALEHLERVSETKEKEGYKIKEKVDTYSEFGLMYQEQENWNGAAYAYAQALEHGEKSELAKDKCSECAAGLRFAFERSGNPLPRDLARKAIDACLAAVKAEPAEVIHHSRLAFIYDYLGDYPRFLDERDKIVRLAEDRATKKDMANYYDQLGVAYGRTGILDMSRTYYMKAIECDDRWEYHRDLGVTLQLLELYDDARKELEPVNKEKPNDYDVMLSLAKVYANDFKRDGKSVASIQAAIDLCRAASKNNPNNPIAYGLLADMLVLQRSFVEGGKEYWEAFRQTKDVKRQEGLLRTGIEAYDRAINASDNRVEVQYGRAGMLRILGNYAEAEKGYLAALNLAGDQPLNLISIHDALADNRYRNGNYDGARTAWEKALAIAAQLSAQDRAALKNAPLGRISLEQITNNLGTAYDSLGAKDEALKIKALDCYQEAALKSPETFAAHFNLAKGLYRQKQFDKALSQFQEAYRLQPPAKYYAQQTLLLIGNCFSCLGRDDLAIEKWSELAQPGVDLAGAAHYNLGVRFWRHDQKKDAVERWESALKASPSLLEAEYNLGISSLEDGDSAGAIIHWKAIAGKPGFESLGDTIQMVEKGEKPALEIKDLRDDI